VNGEGELSEVLSDDFVFGIMPGFPYGGDQNGLQASLEFFDKLGATLIFGKLSHKNILKLIVVI